MTFDFFSIIVPSIEKIIKIPIRLAMNYGNNFILKSWMNSQL